MSITHHPDDSTLLSYAAGALPAALAVVAAAHLAVCRRCRREVADMELLGGALLGALPGATLQRPRPTMPETEPRRPGGRMSMGAAEVPAPLARLVGNDLDATRWRWLS